MEHNEPKSTGYMTRIAVDDYPVLEDLLRAYACMCHHLDRSFLAPHLAEDMYNTSQWVFDEITNKDAHLSYIRPKLANCKKEGGRLWAVRSSRWKCAPYLRWNQPEGRENTSFSYNQR